MGTGRLAQRVLGLLVSVVYTIPVSNQSPNNHYMKHNFQNNTTAHANGAISSDDPQAIEKLETKIKELEKLQEFMKAANNCIRKKDKAAFLLLEYGTEDIWQKVITPDFCNRVGFPAYQLTNNNANISRLKERVITLAKASEKETSSIKIGEVEIIENVEANRLQIKFPSIPAEAIRTKLKQNGFRWCRTECAWQRHLTQHALYIAKQILNN